MTYNSARNKRTYTITSTKRPGILSFENAVINTARRYGEEPKTSHTFDVDEMQLLTALQSCLSPGLLPNDTVWISEDGLSLIVRERARFRTFKMSRVGGIGSHMWTTPPPTSDPFAAQPAPVKKKSSVRDITLPFPNLYYGISPGPSQVPFVSHIYTDGTDQPFTETSLPSNKQLYTLPLPNIFKGGAVCTHVVPEPVDEQEPYYNMVNRAISDFWGSNFNLEVKDYMGHPLYKYFVKQQYKENGSEDGLTHWASLSVSRFISKYTYFKELGSLMPLHLSNVEGLLLAKNDYSAFGTDKVNKMMTRLLIEASKAAVFT